MKVRSISQKIKEKRAVTLAEMLMVVMIMSLVMAFVASTAVVVNRVYRQIRARANAQTLLSTTISEVAGDLYYSQPLEKDGSVAVISSGSVSFPVFYSESRGYYMTFSETDENGLCRVAYPSQADASSNQNGTSFAVIPKKTQPLNLKAKVNGMTYSKGCYSFTVQVYNKDSNKVVESQDVKIKTALYSK